MTMTLKRKNSNVAIGLVVTLRFAVALGFSVALRFTALLRIMAILGLSLFPVTALSSKITKKIPLAENTGSKITGPENTGPVIFKPTHKKKTNMNLISNSIEFRAITGSLRIFLPPFARIGRSESKHKRKNKLRFQNSMPEVRLPKTKIETRCSLNLREFRRMIGMVPSPKKKEADQRAFFPFDAKVRFREDCDYSGITNITRGIITVEHSIKNHNPFYRVQYRLRFSVVRERKTKSRFIRLEIMDGELYHAEDPMTPQMTFAGTVAFELNSYWELTEVSKSEIFVYYLQQTKIEKIIPIKISDKKKPS